MPRRCCIINCNCSNVPGVSTFSFPNALKFPNCFKKWLDFSNLNKCDIDKNIAICEKHFSPFCFNIGKRKTLKPGSIPTNIPSEAGHSEAFCLEDNIKINEKRDTLQYNDILQFIKINIHKYHPFFHIITDTKLLMLIQNTTPPFENLFTVSIEKINKKVEFYSKSKIV